MKHWWTDSELDSWLEAVTEEQCAQLIAEAPRHRNIHEIIVHHTWKPTAAQYRGRSTWAGIDQFHEHERGWSDIGYHLGVGPDLSVWLLRPLPRAGGHCLNHNEYSIGVVMLGNYDAGHDDPARIVPVTARLVRALVARYSLETTDVHFHCEFANKSCPGTNVGLMHFRSLVKAGGTPVPTPTPDTPDVSEWAAPAVAEAIRDGLMSVGDDGLFRGREPVTREMLAEVVYRLRKRPAP